MDSKENGKSSKDFNFHEMVKNGWSTVDKETEETWMRDCYNYFAGSNKDRGMSREEFKRLLDSLFVDFETGRSYYIPQPYQEFFFTTFDFDKDGHINLEDFDHLWKEWLSVILWPKSALVIVDVQNDFITGSLAMKRCPAGHRGEDVIPKINWLLDKVDFDMVAYSMDWHPKDHISFVENAKSRKIVERNGKPVDPTKDNLDNLDVLEVVVFDVPPNKITQKLFPAHCVQNTPGAALHPDLKIVSDPVKCVYVHKGTNSIVDSFSAFWDNEKRSSTILDKELKARGITDIYICGIAMDICVTSTALDGIAAGYRTILVDDACRGVSLKDIDRCKTNLINKNCVIANSEEVPEMTKGIDRRLELAYAWALKLVPIQIK